jgi:LysR family transcriptional activator of glutamate synthase operon
MTYETCGLAPALEVLVAVAAEQSVTAAAQRLGIPQPTVSRTIARLAQELGTDLTVREGRGIRFTRQGLLLAEHAARALNEMRAGITAVRADAEEGHGHVILGFLHSMGPTAVPALLRGFRDTHPSVSFGLVQGSSAAVVAGVLSGEIDLVLASPVPDHADLGVRHLGRQALVALVPIRHRLASRSRIQVAELDGEPLITMRRGYGVRTLTDTMLREAGMTLQYAFESDEVATAAGLVGAGLGVAVLPSDAQTPETVALPLTDRGAHRVISLAWSSRRTLTAPVAALRHHLITHGPAALRQRNGSATRLPGQGPAGSLGPAS